MRPTSDARSRTLEPASLVLVHGAASGPWIFDAWSATFPASQLLPVDLQRDREVAATSMRDFADEVVEAVASAPRPCAVVGWSMGGLVAMMAAEDATPDWLVLLEPSPPVEVQRGDPHVVVEVGVYDGQETYGAFPEGIRSRPDSLLARRQRQRGISVTSLPGPTLVVHGDDYPDVRGRAIAAAYGADLIGVEGLDHWGLVLDPRAQAAVARWLAGTPPAQVRTGR